MESEVVFSRLPYQAEPDEHGPFHRIQCAHINERMCADGIIGGYRSYGVGFRRVHAYVGQLPGGEDGIEFWTRVRPDRGTPPHLAYWTEGSDGVGALEVEGRELVTIATTIVKRVDGYAHCRDCKKR